MIGRPAAKRTRKVEPVTLTFPRLISNVPQPSNPYTRRMTRTGQLRVTTLTLALAFALSLAAAQIDPRAQALLDGLPTYGDGEAVHTIENVMTTTVFAAGADPQEVKSRTIIDYDNRRMLVENELGEGLTSRMILKDGVVTMTMAGMPFALPVPPGTAEQLEATFDEPTSIAVREGDTATYDGEVDYEVLKGEQVTYTTTAPGSGEPVVVHYVFQDGSLVGLYMNSDGSEIAMVYDAPVTTNLLAGADMTTYMMQDGSWNKVSHTKFVSVTINAPIDESVFE